MVVTVVSVIYSKQTSFFNYPGTISPKTVIKTLIIANPGCSPWTGQATN